jgi:DNA polymerase III alpha subunit (gram-positive type)
MKVIFCDVETTGLTEADQIISYCLELWDSDNLVPSGERPQITARVLPTCPVHPMAARVNGYNESEWIASGAIPWDVPHVQHIQGFLDEHSATAKPNMGGHNVEFDLGFFRREFARAGYLFECSHRKVDTMPLAQTLVALGMVSHAGLDACRTYFGLQGQAHTAAGDVQTTIEFWEHMLGVFHMGLQAT